LIPVLQHTRPGKIIKWKNDTIDAAKIAGKEFLENTIKFVKELPGNFWSWLVKTYENIMKWKKDTIDAAKKAGKELLDGFIDKIKSLPSDIWGILKDAVNTVLSYGGVLWDAAKEIAGNFWAGFKKGLGISSPSYIERAIDNIANRASRLPDEVGYDFQKLKGIKLPSLFDNEKNYIDGHTGISHRLRSSFPFRGKASLNEDSQGSGQGSKLINLHLHIGTFIGDKAGLKKLERMLREIRIEEDSRMGLLSFKFGGS